MRSEATGRRRTPSPRGEGPARHGAPRPPGWSATCAAPHDAPPDPSAWLVRRVSQRRRWQFRKRHRRAGARPQLTGAGTVVHTDRWGGGARFQPERRSWHERQRPADTCPALCPGACSPEPRRPRRGGSGPARPSPTAQDEPAGVRPLPWPAPIHGGATRGGQGGREPRGRCRRPARHGVRTLRGGGRRAERPQARRRRCTGRRDPGHSDGAVATSPGRVGVGGHRPGGPVSGRRPPLPRAPPGAPRLDAASVVVGP